jgi:CheY-like chemotaxis protein
VSDIEVPEILEALSKLAWPVLTAFVIWKLYPAIRRIIESRGFKVKIGDMEVTVQQASDQLRAQVEDLQRLVVARERPTEFSQASDTPAEPASPRAVHRILWVDDIPANNAYEIAKLQSDGFEILKALSTSEALAILQGGDLVVDAIVSDMGRTEAGSYDPDAGVKLIEKARAAGIKTPIFVYTTARHAARTRERVAEAGGNGTTKSALELFEMIEQYSQHPA